MTELERLSVSLTKHGAHKVARLLEHYNVNDVLDHTWDAFDGIKIDLPQARKILSALQDDKLPGFWDEAKKQGPASIRRLVILAIIFSHHQLIDIMKKSARVSGRGKITKTQFSSGKVFSNLKNNFVELSFSETDDDEQFTFSLSDLWSDPAFAPLAIELFRHKLSAANWAGTNDIIDECVELGFHKALALSEAGFREWLTVSGNPGIDEDELPEVPDPTSEIIKEFAFRSGHKRRDVDDVARRGSGGTPRARRLHNALQNALHADLSSTYGSKNVGTEVPSGASETCIDVVRKTPDGFIFYEIKTSSSLKKAIREAVPQLLEYAFWPSHDRAKELVIVTTNTSTLEASKYLKMLRDRFGIPIYHETIDAVTGTTSGRI